MNERIRELESTARSWAKNEIAYLERIHNRDYTFDEASEEFNKKFAELIVKECAMRVDNILREKKDGGGTMGDDIKEYFGVGSA